MIWLLGYAAGVVVVFWLAYIGGTYFSAFDAPSNTEMALTSVVAAVLWPILLVGLLEFWVLIQLKKWITRKK